MVADLLIIILRQMLFRQDAAETRPLVVMVGDILFLEVVLVELVVDVNATDLQEIK